MYLIVLLSIAIHGCYIGSKVVVSLLALELGASQFLIGVLASLYALLPLVLGASFGMAPVFWMNAANLAAISWLARR